MGVSCTNYAMFGLALKRGDARFDQFKKVYEKWDGESAADDDGYKSSVSEGIDGYHFIYDGMNGDYVVIGKILAKSLECDGFPFFIVPSDDVTDEWLCEDYIKYGAIVNHINTVYGIVTSVGELRYVCFGHWH